MAAPYTGSGQATGGTPANALPGLDPQWQQLLQSIGGLAGGLGTGLAGGNAPGFQRYAAGGFSPAQPDNLLLAILQMRAQEAAALGAPYASGGMGAQSPRYSLLSG